MSRTGLWATTGAGLMVVLLGVGAWLFFASSGNKAPWNQEGDLAKFIDECFVDLSRRGALDAGNTSAQLKSACKCFGNEFYPLLAGKSREDAAALSRQPDSLEWIQSIRRKCAHQVGLDDVEEWWN